MEFGGPVDVHERACRYATPPAPPSEVEEMELRRGPWTVEEDLILVSYITTHGEGRWNSLARSAGLKRSGKSCRLRWLNYLRPDVRRGNITPEEQLLILELHCRWGNRWSKIAQHLPGRTDNEIKNYWRTRVQKHAKQLKCDVNSKQFKDVMRYMWMPRLMERIRAANSGSGAAYGISCLGGQVPGGSDQTAAPAGSGFGQVEPSPESSGGPMSSFESSVGTHLSSPVTVTTGEDSFGGEGIQLGKCNDSEYWSNWTEPLPSPYPNLGLPDFDCWASGDLNENLWSLEDNWVIPQQQFF